MIQIICCTCAQQKLRRNGVDFYSDNKFYENIKRIFVVPCPRHPFFKDRIGEHFNNIKCNCYGLKMKRCDNWRIICFNLNFLAEKIKMNF